MTDEQETAVKPFWMWTAIIVAGVVGLVCGPIQTPKGAFFAAWGTLPLDFVLHAGIFGACSKTPEVMT